MSPERRRNPDEEFAIGTAGLRYPYSPEQSPTRGRDRDADRLGSTFASGESMLRLWIWSSDLASRCLNGVLAVEIRG